MTSITTSRPREKTRPLPALFPQFCKACGRCLPACPKQCLIAGSEIDPATGLTPVILDLESCNGCGLCFEACPEPFALVPLPDALRVADLTRPANTSGLPAASPLEVEATPDRRIPLPQADFLVLKGTHASAVGAVLAGCRHFYGYPITPSTEGAELLARLLPELDGVFIQAVSEVAAVNMMYGSGGAGMRTMTFTSSPGLSLMLEGISYMIGAEIPGVIVNIMRGGPGLGNIAPEQSDIKLVCRGLGHGNTHAIVFAPSTPQEMLDLTMEAFDLSFRYRNPVLLVGDGYLGQITGRVRLPGEMIQPTLPAWAVYGDKAHRHNLICSIHLDENELEQHNEGLNAKYDRMRAEEQRAECYQTDDAEWLLVACNTPARMALGAVQELRRSGVRAGLFRPVTLWPFPVDALLPLLGRARGIVMVEAGPGQLEDELRLALSHAGIDRLPPIERIRRMGGVLPQLHEIVSRVTELEGL
jgi:pyruvate/2-oxoacid:ferredoxin oxidoreductase alpha subunit/NAD-dependent dihydropyrimidine dehydrogenase PreA subunit